MRPVFDPTGGPDVLVEKMVGKAYDTVRRVSLSLPELKRLDGVLAEIPDLAGSTLAEAITEQLPAVLEEVDAKAATSVTSHLNEAVPPIMEGIQEKVDEVEGIATNVDQLATNAQSSAASSAASSITAATQAVTAHTQADLALAAKAGAEAARDAAQLSSGIFPDTAAGIVGTTDGKFFSVPSADSAEYLILYQNNAGVPVESARYPSTKAVTDLAEDFENTIKKGNQNRSQYWGGMISKTGMVGVAFRKTDGYPIFANGRDVLGDVDKLRSTLNVVSQPRSGVLLGFRTPAGRLLGHFDSTTGAWMVQGRNTLTEVDRINTQLASLEKLIGNPIADFPIADWAAWGDSLVAPGSSGDWPSKFAASIGVNMYNGGSGGEGVRQIAARHGAVPALMTVVGGTIPATGSVDVTTNAYFPASNGRSTTGTLAGILGVYARAADGLSGTFTRVTSGTATLSPPNAKFTPLYGSTMRDRNIILLMGRNSFLYGADPYETVQCIRQMIDYLTPRVKRVMIFEIPPKDTEVTGSPDRLTLDFLNNLLKTTFPEYFVAMATWLRTQEAATAAGITFTPTDLADIANDVTPGSFRSDVLHYNQPAGTAIAYRTKQEAIKRGWIS